MAAPSVTLPCLGRDCAHAEASPEVKVQRHCCLNHAATPVETIADEPGADHPEHPVWPCDCPPECPSACGAGKPPCPPIERFQVTTEAPAIGVVRHLHENQPPEAPREGICHPPRD